MRKVAGIPSVWKGGGTEVARRIVIFQSLSLTKLRRVSADSSVETQTNAMSRPLRSSLAARLAIEGISLRQGGHQVAQRLSRIGRPLKRAKSTGLPSRSSRVQPKSAGLGTPEVSSVGGAISSIRKNRLDDEAKTAHANAIARPTASHLRVLLTGG